MSTSLLRDADTVYDACRMGYWRFGHFFPSEVCSGGKVFMWTTNAEGKSVPAYLEDAKRQFAVHTQENQR